MIDEVWNQQWMDTRIPKGAQINVIKDTYSFVLKEFQKLRKD